MNIDEFKQQVEAGTIDTVLVCMADMQGRLVGKRFAARFFLESDFGETHACNYLLADDIENEPVPGYSSANWEQGYGDFAMLPDRTTLRVLPWLPGTAMVLCDVLDHHSHVPVPHAPRNILKKQLARLKAIGAKAMFASELEFYLFTDNYRDAHNKGYRNLETVGYYIEDYHIFQTSKEEAVMRAIRNGLNAAGIPVENSKGEWGPGQEEINVRYCEALEMADRHVILKNGCKEIAWQHGQSLSFMAKWNAKLAGSSGHIHQSLCRIDTGEPMFLDAGKEHGMSDLMKHFMAGQLAHASEITLFLAPYINSYKRFQAGTFAPTKALWSVDNRTAGFRLVGAGTKGIRTECRIGGADLNPYLAFAALLAAGLDGIEQKLELEPAYRGDAYADAKLRSIPKTLREATAAAKSSAFLRSAFGDDVVDHYVHAAQWEQGQYDRVVTDWELKQGFERY
jgi:glutamine synthetase